MKQRRHNSGFTLIETLVYLSLYAIIIGGALTAVYSIFESSAHNQAQAMVQEEGTFLIGKIDWALSNAISVQAPVTTGSGLSVTRFDGTTAAITQSGADMQFSENGAAPQTLNNTNIGVSSILFTHTKSTADGINPESITASVTVAATTTDGHVFSRSFTTVKYLRK